MTQLSRRPDAEPFHNLDAYLGPIEVPNYGPGPLKRTGPRISRRLLIQMIALGELASLAILATTSPQGPGPSVPQASPEAKPASTPTAPALIIDTPIPGFNAYIKAAPTFKDSTLRAGSITVASEAGLGSAGLFADHRNGDLYILTIGHVAKTLTERTNHFVIPGVGVHKLDRVRWHTLTGDIPRVDQQMTFDLGNHPQMAQLLRDAVASGILNPLAEVIPPNERTPEWQRIAYTESDIALDSDSETQKMTVGGYDRVEQRGESFFDVYSIPFSGRSCRGYSGKPILGFRNNKVTNESYGLKTLAYHVPDYCVRNTWIYVTPHR